MPLHYACEKGFVNVTNVLLDFGANLFSHDFELNTPMELAFTLQRTRKYDEMSTSLIAVLDKSESTIEQN